MEININKIIGYIGTYTQGDSEGIYGFTLDTESGSIENINVAAKLENPTYISIDKNNKYLFSVVKSPDEKNLESNGISAYFLNSSTGELKLINYETLEGKSPCHVSIDKNNRYVFSANYHEGTLSIFPIIDAGSVAMPSDIIKHSGSGPNKERQEAPHVHFVSLSPDEKYLFAVDLGTDRIEAYDFDFEKGKLHHNSNLSISLKPGCGPRHLVFHPNGKFIYVITELSSEVVVLEYNPQDFNVKEIEYISTLPNDFNEENTGAAIHISSDGRYLYTSNRGHNSIAVFSVDEETGKLQLISHHSTLGDGPRDFNIDPTGRFLIAANQNTSNIVTYCINSEAGILKHIGESIEIPNPVCVKFINM